MKGITASALLVLMAIGAGATDPAVRKVAVLSVSGPAFLQAQGRKTNLQPALDYAETSLVRALRAKGLTVVSLPDSKAFTASNWSAAYSNTLRDDAQPHAGEDQSASRNTSLLANPRTTPPATVAFRRTAGKLAREMGADGAVLLTIAPGIERARLYQTIQVAVIAPSGEYIFRGESRGDARTLSDPKQPVPDINAATDEGIQKALEKYSGRN